ncbi:MAG TPA: glutathione S-transferase, partial [Cupriavidus sp.]|nr:glutathione S-transferase [Cupriavidus sp.]
RSSDLLKVWSRAQADIDRITAIWAECLQRYGGPYLFGKRRTIADAMYAPVVTRFITYGVKLDAPLVEFCKTILAMPEMQEWIHAAREEPDEISELDVEF